MVYFSLRTLQRWGIVSVSGRIWRRTYLNISLFSFLITYFIRRRVHALCFITASFPFSFPVFHCQDSRCWRDFQRKSVAFALWDGAGAEIPLSPVNLGSILVVHGIIVTPCIFIFLVFTLVWSEEVLKVGTRALDGYFSGLPFCLALTGKSDKKMQSFWDYCFVCKIPFGST